MQCEEITQVTVAITIMQAPADSRLEKLFHCIYSLFHQSFLNWILGKYGSKSKFKDKLMEDAKDAFENGLMTIYEKSKKNELFIKGSLKTTVYSFGLLQLLAYFKKDKNVYGAIDFLDYFNSFFDDEFSENQRQLFLNERENSLMAALAILPEKQREILLMRFFQKLKSKQIAERLHVTAGSIDNDSTKAYKQLREILITRYNFQRQEDGIDR
jgi:RNA polymerase sigma factor (sigma-70 family)